MTVLSPEWIRQALAAQGATQAELAAAMGIDATKLSKSLAGKRQIKAQEMVLLMRFLGLTVRPSLPGAGFAEPPAPHYSPPFLPADDTSARSIDDLARSLAPGWRHLVAWRTEIGTPAYQIAPGDLIMIGEPPKTHDGDIVMITFGDPDSCTLLGQRVGQAFALPPGTPPPAGEPTVMGTLALVVRSPRS